MNDIDTRQLKKAETLSPTNWHTDANLEDLTTTKIFARYFYKNGALVKPHLPLEQDFKKAVYLIFSIYFLLKKMLKT